MPPVWCGLWLLFAVACLIACTMTGAKHTVVVAALMDGYHMIRCPAKRMRRFVLRVYPAIASPADVFVAYACPVAAVSAVSCAAHRFTVSLPHVSLVPVR